MSRYLMSIFQFNTKHCIRQRFYYHSILFYCRLLCHIIFLNCFITQYFFNEIKR